MKYTNCYVKVNQSRLGRYLERLLGFGYVILYTSHSEAILFNDKKKIYYFVTVVNGK